MAVSESASAQIIYIYARCRERVSIAKFIFAMARFYGLTYQVFVLISLIRSIHVPNYQLPDRTSFLLNTFLKPSSPTICRRWFIFRIVGTQLITTVMQCFMLLRGKSPLSKSHDTLNDHTSAKIVTEGIKFRILCILFALQLIAQYLILGIWLYWLSSTVASCYGDEFDSRLLAYRWFVINFKMINTSLISR